MSLMCLKRGLISRAAARTHRPNVSYTHEPAYFGQARVNFVRTILEENM